MTRPNLPRTSFILHGDHAPLAANEDDK